LELEVEYVPGQHDYVEKLKTEYAAGSLPPIVTLKRDPTLTKLWIENDEPVDLTPYFEASPEWQAISLRDSLELNTIDGKLVAADVARTAARLGATKEVHCLVVEDRPEMLADPFEIAEAEEEGIIIHNHLAPKRILDLNGRATGVETLNVARAFDEHGRFNPQLIPDTEKVWGCDSVIISIGQTGELDWVRPADGLEITPRGTLLVDKETLMTTAPGVFAGGDIAFGPRLIIHAVADGQRAARGIHAYLQNVRPHLVRKGFFTPIQKREYVNVGPLRNYLRWPRRQPPALPIERRIGVARVEVGFDEATAREQAGRCLICTLIRCSTATCASCATAA
jgi:hypothetical protein